MIAETIDADYTAWRDRPHRWGRYQQQVGQSPGSVPQEQPEEHETAVKQHHRLYWCGVVEVSKDVGSPDLRGEKDNRPWVLQKLRRRGIR